MLLVDACRRISLCALLLSPLAVTGATGCSRTTPAGPYGEPIDLKPHLPPGVSPPAESQTTLHRARVEVGDPPAQVDVEWRTFVDGQDAYILSAAAAVYRPADGVHLNGIKVTDIARWPRRDGGHAQGVTLEISWGRSTLRATSGGWENVELRSDGSWR